MLTFTRRALLKGASSIALFVHAIDDASAQATIKTAATLNGWIAVSDRVRWLDWAMLVVYTTSHA